MALVPSTPRVGSVLAQRWRIVRKIGEGPVGEVFAADPVQGGAPVAIKIVRPHLAADPAVSARFPDATRACARLIHPNMVRVLDWDARDGDPPYVVMELLEGVPLGAYTRSGGRVPGVQAVPIAQGVLAGLAAAHAQGIVHRDLKPDNVFLTREPGGTFVVKVLDLWAAEVMQAAGGMGSRSKDGVLLGSPAYMSPEQLKGALSVDGRADLFTLGVILYEMLTGRSAFPAPTDYARIGAVLSTEPEPIDRIDASLAPLAPFVERAMRKNPEARFGTAIEMARSLSGVASAVAKLAPEGGGAPASRDAGQLHSLPQLMSVLAASASSLSQSALAPTLPMPSTDAQPNERRKPGGTLASVTSPSSSPEQGTPPGPAATGGTLPSEGLPKIVSIRPREPKGVRRGVVVWLVALALLAGFLLGWAAARWRT